MPLLKISNLHVSYKSVPAVAGVDLEVLEGEIRVILGANGAGKSTIIKAILGLIKADAGQILFEADGVINDLRKLAPHEIHRLGISWVPEARQLWATMTVLDNLRMGGFDIEKREVDVRIQEMFEWFPRIKERREQLAGSLSGGEQQMVALARAMISQPKLILMDELSLGLAPLTIREVFGLLERVQKRGASILLVEQNARQALKVANWGYLLETGRVVESGTAEEIARDENVQQVFLGTRT